MTGRNIHRIAANINGEVRYMSPREDGFSTRRWVTAEDAQTFTNKNDALKLAITYAQLWSPWIETTREE